MERKVALIFPGQGAQYVGMGKDFYEGYSFAKETFQEAEDFLQMKLSTILFEGPEDELKKNAT